MHTHNKPWRTYSSKKTEDKNKETDVKCKITFRVICDTVMIKYSPKLKEICILQGNRPSYLYVIIWHEINFFLHGATTTNTTWQLRNLAIFNGSLLQWHISRTAKAPIFLQLYSLKIN